jgi:hypothetical protein
MQDGRPGAAMIPAWCVNITKDGAEREVQELKVCSGDQPNRYQLEHTSPLINKGKP